eukprot:CAMPEP_0175276676 /NCGR_PEP_ID=MMETSP0093-20121207/48608_1 /TAXON_ID=311494 /ORGANISM="Alexandrium monilatum, Strain CCMP3105" /LENGTH=205 /DNA_ID=CAMNT_0016571593 /DNA_START=164 /DNA_END=780 /DNA_ORIENTATION=-
MLAAQFDSAALPSWHVTQTNLYGVCANSTSPSSAQAADEQSLVGDSSSSGKGQVLLFESAMHDVLNQVVNFDIKGVDQESREESREQQRNCPRESVVQGREAPPPGGLCGPSPAHHPGQRSPEGSCAAARDSLLEIRESGHRQGCEPSHVGPPVRVVQQDRLPAKLHASPVRDMDAVIPGSYGGGVGPGDAPPPRACLELDGGPL